MSDTPRTDKAIFAHYDEMFDEEFEYVEPQFARNLEREADKLAKQCVRNVEEIGQLRDELRQIKEIDVGLIPGRQWTLERFASICEIRMPEAATVGGNQLLDLLKDAKRMDYIVENNIFGITRDDIDKDMEAQNDDV